MADKPSRAFELRIAVGGDTWDDIVRELRFLLPHVEAHGQACNSVSGSPSSNHLVTIVHRPEMTHERYMADLEAARKLIPKP